MDLAVESQLTYGSNITCIFRGEEYAEQETNVRAGGEQIQPDNCQVTFEICFGTGKVITWSLTLREEHRLRVFENRVLRRTFGSKRDEVTGGWRKLHNEELHNLYSSPSIIRIIKSRRVGWAGHVARMGEEECM
jgi:hypothetical protein